MRPLALALFLSACLGRVHSRPAERVTETLDSMTWCVSATIGVRRLVACTDDEMACEMWRDQARRRGRLVGVTSMSGCEPR